jgi:hypothetical protein
MIQYIITDIDRSIDISTKINEKKTLHDIDPPFSGLISIFKTNYCITSQGVKGYLQPGVPRTSNIWIASSHFVEHNWT